MLVDDTKVHVKASHTHIDSVTAKMNETLGMLSGAFDRRLRDTERFIFNALKDGSSAVKGAECLVIGSNRIWVEPLLLALGARKVVVLEYNPLAYDHPAIETITVADYERQRAEGSWQRRFTCALSLSSYDHDGLGRYGDPISPDGDLLSMDELVTHLLAPTATLFLQVPVGPDHLCWNLHRRYGPVRLPLLLDGFVVEAVQGLMRPLFDIPRPVTKPVEPVFTLRPYHDGNGTERAIDRPATSVVRVGTPALKDLFPAATLQNSGVGGNLFKIEARAASGVNAKVASVSGPTAQEGRHDHHDGQGDGHSEL